MNKALVLTLTLAAATAALSAPATAPARAADSMEKIDCSQAEAMFTDAAKSHVAADTMSGDIDKDFMMLAMDNEKATQKIMKIEAQCGKDPKMKAMAAKESTDSDARMALFRNQNMSQ
jgi:hypothetical protein